MKLTEQERRHLSWWGRGIAGFFVVWTVVSIVFPLLPPPWPPFYWALPIHGRVVAADSHTPLEGVSVVAHWELVAPWGISRGQLAVMESVTDKEGRFSFSWWYPRLRFPLEAHLISDAPGLLFFKSGYASRGCVNATASRNLNPFPMSDCNGTTLELEKFAGTEKEYASDLDHLDTSLSFAIRKRENCEWARIPHMIAALIQEGEKLRSKGIPNHLPTLTTFPNKGWCGSREKIFRRYLPS